MSFLALFFEVIKFLRSGMFFVEGSLEEPSFC
jgi:hypothetical protein